MPHQDRLNIAVFVDFDNIEIGVKNTLGQQFDIGTILDAIKERGEVVTKIAYADWTRAGEYSRSLTQHAIRLVQRNLTPGGDKNGADINLALDALEMAFTHPHINAYVIVGGDSDFLSLVEKLKQYDKKVFVVGGRAFTSVILQRNCHEFIAYENLAGVRKPAVKGGRPVGPLASSPIAQAFPIVRRGLKILADREVSPQTGLLKSTLLQLDSTFSERNYGASSFLDFVEKLAQTGLVHLKTAGRSVMVELNETFAEDADGAAARPRQQEAEASPANLNGSGTASGDEMAGGSAPVNTTPTDMPVATHPPADGVKLAGQILGAAQSARWPMYLRNVKQILRAADGGFDERRYGFAGLMDLLRGCQRDGYVRLERDRRGGLRVFPGANLHRPPTLSPSPEVSIESMPMAAGPVDPVDVMDGAESELAVSDLEPMPTVDPTAELLGTVKRRRAPRARTAPGAQATRVPASAAPRKSGARKAAAPRRTTRSKRNTSPDTSDDTDRS